MEARISKLERLKDAARAPGTRKRAPAGERHSGKYSGQCDLWYWPFGLDRIWIDTLHDGTAYSTSVALAVAEAKEDGESRSGLAQGKVDVMPVRVGTVPSKTKISSDSGCSKDTVHQHSSAVAEIEDEVAVALVEVAEREAALKADEVTQMTVEEDVTVEASDEACNGSYQELVAGKAPCTGNARVKDDQYSLTLHVC